jgi:hypothetical protein
MRVARTIACLITAVALTVPLGHAAHAAPRGDVPPSDPLCGWTGNVTPLIAKADHEMARADVAARAQQYYGKRVQVGEITRVEVDLLARDPAATRPLDPATLTENRVAYNIQLIPTPGADEVTASMQFRFRGLCSRASVFDPGPWVGSIGTAGTIKVSARKALKLAREYRRSTGLPLNAPLVSMALMQATTAPPDFGKLRWVVTYDQGASGLSVQNVYMNGRVRPN